MEIGKRFNKLQYRAYLHIIPNHKKYTDFNHLGMFRSVLENKKLTKGQQIEIRDLLIVQFPKFHRFLQVKDPSLYIDLYCLDHDLSEQEIRKMAVELQTERQKILKKKKIRHRNFGTYSRHNCGIEWCSFNGMMVKAGSFLCEGVMGFQDDHSYGRQKKKKKKPKHKKNLFPDDDQ